VTALVDSEAEPPCGLTTEPPLGPFAEPFVWAPPVPVLAPYLGLVTAVLCALGGGWLLLAPYALDYRHGALSTPRTTQIDLATGAAVVAIAAVSAALFSATLVRRLRTPAEAVDSTEPEPICVLDPDTSEPFSLMDEPPAEPGPEPEPAPARPEPSPDPNNALRDLLTPLVAALAADLKSRADNPQGGSSR
jgi:hypothetical protein